MVFVVMPAKYLQAASLSRLLLYKVVWQCQVSSYVSQPLCSVPAADMWRYVAASMLCLWQAKIMFGVVMLLECFCVWQATNSLA